MKHKEENDRVKNIGTYIETIKNLTNNISENTVVVYRGENVYYPTYCQPNLFRNNYFKNNKYFERNLLDEMRSNRLTNGNTYLETAVDAQHGGFPSRLLDVTYNSLIALYFAITPSIKKEEWINDGKDGYVYVYYIKNLFCPSANNINELFDGIVNRKTKWMCDNTIFQRNHKLIDHIKINNRIIAQQGAFILFQGDEVSPIQNSDYKTIVIDGASKEDMRNDLKRLFGIHSGSIYPEIDNLVKDIEVKSDRINNNEFSLDNELDLVINNLTREINYFKEKIIDCSNKFDKDKNEELIDQMIKIIMDSERCISYYKEELKELKLYECHNLNIDSTIINYNKLVYEFVDYIEICIEDFDIEVNIENLKV
ncbi:FRG domain [uncultured Clostridium sp.]|nr:FRG domain [uncultured Clostridium sp.]SCJ06428.1 FRG domain [uncultured Clostridium sp.]